MLLQDDHHGMHSHVKHRPFSNSDLSFSNLVLKDPEKWGLASQTPAGMPAKLPASAVHVHMLDDSGRVQRLAGKDNTTAVMNHNLAK